MADGNCASDADTEDPIRCWREGGGSLPCWLSEPLTAPLAVPLGPPDPPLVLLPRVLSESVLSLLAASFSNLTVNQGRERRVSKGLRIEHTLRLRCLSFAEFL